MVASRMAARHGWRLAAVFVLMLAVVGMHSLGAGHHGAALAAHHETAQLTSASTIATGTGSHHKVADSETVMASTVAAHQAVATCLECAATGGGAMAAMCLAVVSSLLALALLLALQHLLRRRVALILRPFSRAPIAMRSPLRRMALSPIEVCVLRT